MHRLSSIARVVPFLLLAAGCATQPNVPNLGELYSESARYHAAERNPVIVIPGILGSRLEETASGTVVWGAFGGGAANPSKPEGARLCALPMAEGVPLEELHDDVVSVAALDRLKVSVLGLPFQLRAYMNILGTLGVGGYRDQQLSEAGVDYGEGHFTCFQFHYDWRRSNVENAHLLYEFILEKREYVAGEYERRFGVENPEVKFDIVAHSMGGLLTRYMLRYGQQPLPDEGRGPKLNWDGAKLVDRLIMVGTPNAGSAKSVEQLVEGLDLRPIARYRPAILDTMPAIYELMPRPRHGAVRDSDNRSLKLDFYHPELWEQLGWGLAGAQPKMLKTLLPDIEDPEERKRIASDHLRKCLRRAQRFHEVLDVPARPPEGLEIFLFAGDAEPTDAVYYVDTMTGEIVDHETWQGDATVVRQSALMDERMGQEWVYMLKTPIQFTGVSFLFSSHLGMTKDPMFTDNVLYLLLEDPRSKLSSDL